MENFILFFAILLDLCKNHIYIFFIFSYNSQNENCAKEKI